MKNYNNKKIKLMCVTILHQKKFSKKFLKKKRKQNLKKR